QLREHIDAFIEAYNENAKAFAWTNPKSIKSASKHVSRTNDSGYQPRLPVYPYMAFLFASAGHLLVVLGPLRVLGLFFACEAASLALPEAARCGGPPFGINAPC
ncbi:MAG: hypothetical protein CR217_14100, partial [Beijerinckiaceae bacterium]